MSLVKLLEPCDPVLFGGMQSAETLPYHLGFFASAVYLAKIRKFEADRTFALK